MRGPQNADDLIRLNRDLLALAEQARAEAQRVRAASFDARIQRAFSINRPGLWGDMMAAWAFARARATARVLTKVSVLEQERALHLWRCALALSPAARSERLLSGPH